MGKQITEFATPVSMHEFSPVVCYSQINLKYLRGVSKFFQLEAFSFYETSFFSFILTFAYCYIELKQKYTPILKE